MITSKEVFDFIKLLSAKTVNLQISIKLDPSLNFQW